VMVGMGILLLLSGHSGTRASARTRVRIWLTAIADSRVKTEPVKCMSAPVGIVGSRLLSQ
jgi:hypothetical protein